MTADQLADLFDDNDDDMLVEATNPSTASLARPADSDDDDNDNDDGNIVGSTQRKKALRLVDDNSMGKSCSLGSAVTLHSAAGFVSIKIKDTMIYIVGMTLKNPVIYYSNICV